RGPAGSQLCGDGDLAELTAGRECPVQDGVAHSPQGALRCRGLVEALDSHLIPQTVVYCRLKPYYTNPEISTLPGRRWASARSPHPRALLLGLARNLPRPPGPCGPRGPRPWPLSARSTARTCAACRTAYCCTCATPIPSRPPGHRNGSETSSARSATPPG